MEILCPVRLRKHPDFCAVAPRGRRGLCTGERVVGVCVNGEEHEYRKAKIYPGVASQTYQMILGVVDKLSHPVVI